MPTITSLKQQKNKDRVNVYLDGKFGFGIDLVNFAQLHLKVDQGISEEKIVEIVKSSEFQKTLDKLLRFATLRPRSEKEINDYLRRKKVHESLHKELLAKLKHFDLLDDKKFARWWVDQRIEFKKKSKRIIKQELLQKGVDRNLIDDALGDTLIDEEGMARDLISKKAQRWQALPPREAKLKKSQYLFGKGFEWNVIEKVVGEVVE